MFSHRLPPTGLVPTRSPTLCQIALRPMQHLGEVLMDWRSDHGYVDSSATFSDCGTYRYELSRQLAPVVGRVVLFVGLNPSSATMWRDDPTIRRCVGFARRWGFDKCVVMNAFGLITTDPKGLTQVEDPEGPGNEPMLRERLPEAEMVVAAWGAFKLLPIRLADLVLSNPNTHCLKRTKGGYPGHPLYLAGSTQPVRWYRG